MVMNYSELYYRIPEIEDLEIESPLQHLDQYCNVYNPFESFQKDVQTFLKDALSEDLNAESTPVHFRTYRQLKKLLDISYLLSQLLYLNQINIGVVQELPVAGIRDYLCGIKMPLDNLSNKELQNPEALYAKFFSRMSLADWHVYLHSILECACTEGSFKEKVLYEEEAFEITRLLESVFELTYYINSIHNKDFPNPNTDPVQKYVIPGT